MLSDPTSDLLFILEYQITGPHLTCSALQTTNRRTGSPGRHVGRNLRITKLVALEVIGASKFDHAKPTLAVCIGKVSERIKFMLVSITHKTPTVCSIY